MRKLYSFIAAIFLVAASLTANAQDEFNELIKSSPADATKLLSAYADPLFKGFGIGLNSGWNNTAQTKKLLHFDLRITGNVALVPVSERTFDVTKIGLSNNLTVDKTVASNTNIAQTFAGSDAAKTPIMSINDNAGTKIGSFELPKGVSQYIPAPNIQLTVGLIHNTDVTARITPDIKLSDEAGTVSMFGIGFKHNIIKDFVKASTFDLAVAVNYNQIKYTKPLDVKPDNGSTPAPGQSAADFNNQKISATFKGVNVQAIISKKLLFFTPFAAVSYQTASTNLGVLGNFPLQSTTPGQGTNYVVVKDPVSIDKNTLSGIRGDVGFQLNLAILRIYASVGSGSGYVSGNAGIGLGF